MKWLWLISASVAVLTAAFAAGVLVWTTLMFDALIIAMFATAVGLAALALKEIWRCSGPGF